MIGTCLCCRVVPDWEASGAQANRKGLFGRQFGVGVVVGLLPSREALVLNWFAVA